MTYWHLFLTISLYLSIILKVNSFLENSRSNSFSKQYKGFSFIFDDTKLNNNNPSYSFITVREVVEWTLKPNHGFGYIDIRTAEELEESVSPRGAVNIPAFQTDGNWKDSDAIWKPVENFAETVEKRFEKGTKIIVGYKATVRQMKSCEMLVQAGFEHVFCVESQSFLRTKNFEEF